MFFIQNQDYYTGTKEKKCFEESMYHEMKYGSRPGSDTKSKEHIAYLAYCGICQDSFQIVLAKCTETGNQKCQCSDDGYC